MNIKLIKIVEKLSSLSDAELKLVEGVLEVSGTENRSLLEVVTSALEEGGDELIERVENARQGPPELEDVTAKMGELELLKTQCQELMDKMECLAAKSGDICSEEPVSRFLSPIRDFKIQGNIGSPGEKGKLSYVSLIRQIELGIEKKYSEKEIVQSVVNSIP